MDWQSWLSRNINGNIFESFLISMDKEGSEIENRFKDFEEVFGGNGVAIGFTIPGNSFLFRYDAQGGWKDEKGNQYNSEGTLIHVGEGDLEDEDEEEDEEILDEFEKMLENEEKPKEKVESKPNKKQAVDLDVEHKKYLTQYKQKEKVRDGLPAELPIYFKMRAKAYSRIKPSVEKEQSIDSKNKRIQEIKEEVEKERKGLMEKNKWLGGEGVEFQHSGAQFDEVTYDRYWYGVVLSTHEHYDKMVEEIEGSEEFALLKSKTFYALKSKFYLKKKMQETIVSLQGQLSKLEDDDLVRIVIGNLPQNFPCSLILDLCSFSSTPLALIKSITLADEYTAEIVLAKKAALNFLNIEGYCYEEGQFIELNIEFLENSMKIKESLSFKVGVQMEEYKQPERELHDTLALLKSRDELLKIYTEEEEKKDGFRFVVGRKCLKQVLMFRGENLSVNRVEAM